MHPPARTRPGAWPRRRRVDPAVAHEVAAAYLDAPRRRDPLAAAAYARLVDESDRLFRQITVAASGRRGACRVHQVSRRRTTTPQELIRSVNDGRVLEITTVATDADPASPADGQRHGRGLRPVPCRPRRQWAMPGLELGFDRDGEFAVWLSQERFHSPLARRALATELHGQHSVRWTTGEVAEPKAVLLDPGLLSRTRASRSPSASVRSAGSNTSTSGTPSPTPLRRLQLGHGRSRPDLRLRSTRRRDQA